MSLGNIVALLGAGMSGYMKGRDQKRQQDAEDADAEFKNWQRQQMKDQADRDAALRGDVAASTAPVTMQEVAGKPDTMDNIDVGQDGETPVAPNTYTANGQTFTDPAAAQAAAAAANTPSGQAQRLAAAYAKNGQGAMAMQVRRDAQQAELADLGLQQKHLEIANEQFDNLLQQQGSHDALAAFVSNSQHDGQGGGLKIQAIPSSDGKTVTYAKINDDGSITSTGHTYTNDDAGLQQAQLWLSRATPLATKIANLHQQAQDKLAADKEASESKERDARARYYDAMGAAAGIKAEKVGSGKTPLYDRMDESDKLELQNAYKASTEVDGLINKGMADGSLTKDSDNYKFLVARKAAADLKARSVLARYADDSDGGAGDPLGLRGGSPAGGGMVNAASLAATPFDASGITGANRNAILRDIATRNPDPNVRLRASTALSGGPDVVAASQPGAAPAAEPEPGARRVQQTPVVNFNPRSGGNARMQAAQSKLPALTAAVDSAKANLAAAKGKGPMAVAAARDAWNNAKTALAEAQARAGETVAADTDN